MLNAGRIGRFLLYLTLGVHVALGNSVSDSTSPESEWPIPPYHWSYRYLLEANLRSEAHVAWLDRPVYTGDLRGNVLHGGEEWASIVAPLFTSTNASFAARSRHLRLGMYVTPGWVAGRRARYGMGEYRLLLTYSPLPGVTAVHAMILSERALHDANYMGKRWRGLAGYSEQAYVAYRTGRWGFLLGRDFLVWGAGETGELLFSDNSRPLDQLRVSYKGKYFDYTFLTAQLNPERVPDSLRNTVQAMYANRYLSAVRVGFRWRKRFFVAVVQSILFGGPNAPYSWTFGNPAQWFHGALLNKESAGPYGGGGNTLGSIDWDLYPGRGWEVYGQFLLDDIQVEKTGPGDLEPNELGLLTGFRKADPFSLGGVTCGLEYVAVRNRTYKTAQFWEWWVHRNKPIGYYLGSDVELLAGFVRYWPNRHVSLTLRWNRIRLGEGRMDRPWDTPWATHTLEEGYHESFPSGVVETTSRLGVELFWLVRPGLFGLVEVGWLGKSNAGHVTGQRERAWEMKLQFGWEWDFGFPLW